MKRIITTAYISLSLIGGSINFAEEKKVTAQEGRVNEITTENFNALVKNSAKPVVIDFYATWCQPCNYMKPTFAELAREKKDWLFASVDIDKNPKLKADCGVQVVPTFVLFKNGIQWGMVIGRSPKKQLMEEFNKIMSMKQPAAVP